MKFTLLPFLLLGAFFGPISGSAIPATDVAVVSRGLTNITTGVFPRADDWEIVEYDGPSDGNGCTGTAFQATSGPGTTDCKKTSRTVNCVDLTVNIPGILSCTWNFKHDVCTESNTDTKTVNNGASATGQDVSGGAGSYGVDCS